MLKMTEMSSLPVSLCLSFQIDAGTVLPEVLLQTCFAYSVSAERFVAFRPGCLCSYLQAGTYDFACLEASHDSVSNLNMCDVET